MYIKLNCLYTVIQFPGYAAVKSGVCNTRRKFKVQLLVETLKCLRLDKMKKKNIFGDVCL